MQGAKLLIGDIGATSADWAFCDANQTTLIRTPGHNPVVQSKEVLTTMLDELRAQLPVRGPFTVHYYGAGVGSDIIRAGIAASIRDCMSIQDIYLHSDLLAAARATYQYDPGVICILGTGSNAGIYDGMVIVDQAAVLGYPLGDEGSGTDIGKRLIKSYYYGLLPEEIARCCREVLPLERYEFLARLQQSPQPNRYLASHAKLVMKHRSSSIIQKLVGDSFDDFISCHLSDQIEGQKINFAGSIAYNFRKELRASLERNRFYLGEVVKSPLEGLIEYHLQAN